MEGAVRFRVLVRVSDDKLRSTPQQVADCVGYVAGLGRPDACVDGLYNVGEHSGFSMTESEVYRRLLEDAKRGDFHALVVRDTSRLGRDYWEKLGTLRDLRAAKVEFHVVEEGGRFDFEDRLHKVKNFASSWADEEKKKEEIRKAVRATEALRDAGLPTVRPPFGYRAAKDPALGRRVWRPDANAEKVRALFAAALARPDAAVAELAREQRMPAYQAERVLGNRAYTGGFTWRGSFHPCDPKVIPPLVPAEAFAALEARRAARRRPGAP